MCVRNFRSEYHTLKASHSDCLKLQFRESRRITVEIVKKKCTAVLELSITLCRISCGEGNLYENLWGPTKKLHILSTSLKKSPISRNFTFRLFKKMRWFSPMFLEIVAFRSRSQCLASLEYVLLCLNSLKYLRVFVFGGADSSKYFWSHFLVWPVPPLQCLVNMRSNM